MLASRPKNAPLEVPRPAVLCRAVKIGDSISLLRVVHGCVALLHTVSAPSGRGRGLKGKLMAYVPPRGGEWWWFYPFSEVCTGEWLMTH